MIKEERVQPKREGRATKGPSGRDMVLVACRLHCTYTLLFVFFFVFDSFSNYSPTIICTAFLRILGAANNNSIAFSLYKAPYVVEALPLERYN